MNQRFVLGAYWNVRKESAEECADRAQKFFHVLVASDPAFTAWFERTNSRRQALEKQAKVDDQNYLLDLLNRGRNKRDTGGSSIEELGFRIGLWNGGSAGREAGLTITCGLHWRSRGANVSLANSVVLDLPEDLGQLGQQDQMVRLLRGVIQAWKPDWAGVMSKRAMRERAFNANAPFVDWMIFLPKSIVDLPAPSRVLKLDGHGSLVIVQPSPPSGNDSVESERIYNVERLIQNG